jgi:hypothetical protein
MSADLSQAAATGPKSAEMTRIQKHIEAGKRPGITQRLSLSMVPTPLRVKSDGKKDSLSPTHTLPISLSRSLSPTLTYSPSLALFFNSLTLSELAAFLL